MKSKVLMFLLVSCSLITMGPMCGSGATTLEIAGVTPDDGAINVLLDQTVEMTTNVQSIDHDTITNQNFYVRDANGNDVPGTVAGTIPAPDITVSMAFTPTNPWNEGEVYTATITTGLKVIVGRDQERLSLSEDYSWSFTIRKWFEVGEAVSPEEAGAENPTMMIVGGSPSVGYLYNSSQENLQFFSGTAWDPTEADPTGGASTSSDGAPGFCTDGTNVYLAYSSESTPTIDHDHVLAYQWDPTNKWRPMNTGNELSLNNQYSATQATMACGSSFAAWVQGASSSEAEDAYVADVTLGGSTRSGPLSRLGALQYGSDVANVTATVDGTDVYLAFWENNGVDADTQNRTSLYVSKWDGANFTNVGGLIASDLAGAADPVSLVVSGGNLYLAYTAVTETDGPELLYVAKHDGADWATMGGAIAAYEGDDHVGSNDPDLIMGDKLYVAWEESDSIFVAYWDETSAAWVISDLNRIINQHIGSDSSDPSLAYSAAEEVLYITLLVNKTGYYQVFVMKRNK